MKFGRWWLFPVLFTILAWALLLLGGAQPPSSTTPATAPKLAIYGGARAPLPEPFKSIPRIISFGRHGGDGSGHAAGGKGREGAESGPTVSARFLPQSRSAAFELGEIWSQVDRENLSGVAETRLLERAAQVLDLPSDTPVLPKDALRGMVEALKAQEKRVTVLRMVRGIFTVVNTIWLVACIGIAVSIGPSIYYVLKPLRTFLRRVARWVWEHAIQPAARRMHDWGVFELIAWAVCAVFCLDARRFYEGEAGVYVGFTGVALAIPSLAYSTLLHGADFVKRNRRNSALKAYVETWALLTTMPLALVFDSAILGFVTAVVLFMRLGFGGFAGPFCFVVGFDSGDEMVKASLASYAMLTAAIALRIYGHDDLIAPFRPGLSVMGSILLGIANLIISSLYYRRYDAKKGSIPPYAARQLFPVWTMLSGLYFGTAFEIEGMANTATVFLVLYGMTKWSEIHFELRLSAWLFMLLGSAALWRLSLWMHAHPSLIYSLFWEGV